MRENLIKNPAELSIGDQVTALCLGAKERVSAELVIEWIKQIKGAELWPEEEKLVRSSYETTSGSINWGNRNNDLQIEERLGITAQSIHKVIADNLFRAIFGKKEWIFNMDNRAAFLPLGQ